MKATVNRLAERSGRRIFEILTGASPARAHPRGQRGFTLVELLAVMAIIGILAGVVAGAVSGLSTVGQTAQIVSDTKTIETAADRFFNDAFPQAYPVLPLAADDPLAEDAGDLGVRLLDFEARLPQDPTITFTPDFVKDIPDSAALVSYRVDTNTGNVFAAAEGAQLVKPATTRLDITTGPTIDDRETSANTDYTFKLRMKKNEASVQTLSVEIPAGYSLGGSSVPLNSVMGELQIVFSSDNPWDAGQVITVATVDILATGEANSWTIPVEYDDNTSTSGDQINVKDDENSQPADDRTHTIKLIAPTEETPGKLTLVMDRTTEDAADPPVTTHSDPAHNEATETWTLVIFDIARTGGGSPIANAQIFTNPAVVKVYRWLTNESTTIDVDKLFNRVSGLQSVVIKAPVVD